MNEKPMLVNNNYNTVKFFVYLYVELIIPKINFTLNTSKRLKQGNHVYTNTR
jgi:hypothetical protein